MAPQFDVVEAGAVAQCIVGEVEDVITLVIREVVLQQVESFVNGLGEPEPADEKLDGPNAAAGDASGLGSSLVMDVGGGQNRLWRRCCAVITSGSS